MVGLCASKQELLPPVLASIVVLVAHGVGTHVQSQANSLGSMLHVAASLDDIFRGYLEGGWAVFLFEAPCEVALMIVLPFEHA